MKNKNLKPGSRVVVNIELDTHKKRGYELTAIRRPGDQGVVRSRHNSHGLCYGVVHGDLVIGYYAADEIEVCAGDIDWDGKS